MGDFLKPSSTGQAEGPWAGKDEGGGALAWSTDHRTKSHVPDRTSTFPLSHTFYAVTRVPPIKGQTITLLPTDGLKDFPTVSHAL